MEYRYRNRTVILLLAAATTEPLDSKVEEIGEGWAEIPWGL